ncbi:MAG: hypothetical protein R2940_16740 [Syntrophotaleaceae bacterium]
MAETTVAKSKEQCKGGTLLPRKDRRSKQLTVPERDILIKVSMAEKEFILAMRQLSELGHAYIMQKICLRNSWEEFVARNREAKGEWVAGKSIPFEDDL